MDRQRPWAGVASALRHECDEVERKANAESEGFMRAAILVGIVLLGMMCMSLFCSW